MSQYARFIRPGYYRVESSIYPPNYNIGITAYKDSASSKIVIVAVNNSSSPAEQVFRIQNGSIPVTLTTYTTSESKNCEKGNSIDVTNETFTISLEPSSITTYVSN